MPKGKINILDQRPQFAQNSASGAHLIGSVQEPVLKVSVIFTLGIENEKRVVVVSYTDVDRAMRADRVPRNATMCKSFTLSVVDSGGNFPRLLDREDACMSGSCV